MTGSGGGFYSGVEVTEDQKAQQKVNAKLWNYYESTYKPIIEAYAKNTTSDATKTAESNKVAGQINAEIMKNVKAGTATSNATKNAKQMSEFATLKTQAEEKGDLAVKSKQNTEAQNIINIGRGQATEASKDLGSLAEESIASAIKSKEIEVQQKGIAEASMATIIGAGAGAATKGLTMAWPGGGGSGTDTQHAQAHQSPINFDMEKYW
jgi:hypothetical protein